MSGVQTNFTASNFLDSAPEKQSLHIIQDNQAKNIITADQKLVAFLKDKKFNKAAKTIEILSNPNHKITRALKSKGSLLGLGMNLASSTIFKHSPLFNVLGLGAYRSFVFLNGILAGLSAMTKNRVFASFKTLEAPMALFVPMRHLYKIRGYTVGLQNAADALHKSAKDKPNGAYTDLGHAFKVISKRFLEFGKELGQDTLELITKKDTIKNKLIHYLKNTLMNEDKGTMGVIGGLSSIIGATFALGGKDRQADFFRNFTGALAVDAERFNPVNLQKGRLMYWLTGALFSVGSIADMFKATPVQIIFDSLGTMSSVETYMRGELDKNFKGQAIPQPWKNPSTFTKHLLSAFKDMFTGSNSSLKKNNETTNDTTYNNSEQETIDLHRNNIVPLTKKLETIKK